MGSRAVCLPRSAILNCGYLRNAPAQQVCINAATDVVYCDERLEVPVGSWEVVHIDVFERFMDKLGPRVLSTVMYQTWFIQATPYNATFTNSPGAMLQPNLASLAVHLGAVD